VRHISLVLCCACFAPLIVVPAAAEASAGDAMVRAINAARQSKGGAPLRVSMALHRSSDAYSRWMIERDSFGHRARIRASRRFSRVGEVLAFAPGSTADIERTVRDWQASPAHRAVLFDRAFRFVGTGRARGGFGDRQATVWTVQLGVP